MAPIGPIPSDDLSIGEGTGLALPFYSALSAPPLLALPFLSLSSTLLLPSLPLQVGPFKIQLGDLGNVESSPSGVWGRVPVEIEFGAEKMISVGDNFNYFLENK